MLREKGVVSKFVEFFGPGLERLPLADRATIGNMSPEFGSTCAIFPVDAETLRYLEFTGRPTEQIELVDAYTREQGLFHEPDSEDATYSDTLELDLGDVEPSIAGPKRPQDRIPLVDAKPAFLEAMEEWDPEAGKQLTSPLDEALEESFPASDPPAEDHGNDAGKPRQVRSGAAATELHPKTGDAIAVQLESGESVHLDHGHVVIAAITSCTNTSNPSVMLAAGLVARKAVERGLKRQPWVKTSLAPGSTVVTEYLEKSGLDKYLNQLQFNLVGYGCTTCIGNSGPLPEEISKAIAKKDLVVCSVLSGNRNFEGRINPDTRANYLASPPLVVAYALTGRMDVDLTTEPLGRDSDDEPVYLSDIWPSSDEIAEAVGQAVRADMFTKGYSDVFTGDKRWKQIEVPKGDRYTWPDSTYVRRPSFFEGMKPEPEPVKPVAGARVLALLGDSVTTDHISPAGAIKKDSPAGSWLIENGVDMRDFNSYGSRRGNHEVMIRGTFANVRMRNRLVEKEGGFTRKFPEGEETTHLRSRDGLRLGGRAAGCARRQGVRLGLLARLGREGNRAARVRAVIAESFERIHRSNLIGMGVLPLQFPEGASIDSLGLTGEESFDIGDLQDGEAKSVEVTATRDGADPVSFEATVRIDTPNEVAYFQNGGILHRVLRDLTRPRLALLLLFLLLHALPLLQLLALLALLGRGGGRGRGGSGVWGRRRGLHVDHVRASQLGRLSVPAGPSASTVSTSMSRPQSAVSPRSSRRKMSSAPEAARTWSTPPPGVRVSSPPPPVRTFAAPSPVRVSPWRLEPRRFSKSSKVSSSAPPEETSVARLAVTPEGAFAYETVSVPPSPSRSSLPPRPWIRSGPAPPSIVFTWPSRPSRLSPCGEPITFSNPLPSRKSKPPSPSSEAQSMPRSTVTLAAASV